MASVAHPLLAHEPTGNSRPPALGSAHVRIGPTNQAMQVGPPRFPTSTQRWRLMHKPANKKEVDLSGICEARDKHSNKLYRLFCVIDRDAPAHGLALPSLVLLGGVVKPARTEAPQSEYRRIDRYRKDYQAAHRVAHGRGGAEWWPDTGVDMS